MPGLEVIKLEFILKLKIKRNDWLLEVTFLQAANRYAFFEFETVLKFYSYKVSVRLAFLNIQQQQQQHQRQSKVIHSFVSDTTFAHNNICA